MISRLCSHTATYVPVVMDEASQTHRLTVHKLQTNDLTLMRTCRVMSSCGLRTGPAKHKGCLCTNFEHNVTSRSHAHLSSHKLVRVTDEASQTRQVAIHLRQQHHTPHQKVCHIGRVVRRSCNDWHGALCCVGQAHCGYKGRDRVLIQEGKKKSVEHGLPGAHGQQGGASVLPL